MSRRLVLLATCYKHATECRKATEVVFGRAGLNVSIAEVLRHVSHANLVSARESLIEKRPGKTTTKRCEYHSTNIQKTLLIKGLLFAMLRDYEDAEQLISI